MNTVIVIMTKWPRHRSVKTRLAPIPAAARVRLAQAFLDDTVALAASAPQADALIAVDPPSAASHAKARYGADLGIFAQTDGDLGRRMSAAFGHATQLGYGHVLMVGSDAPDLPGGHLGAAADLLREWDVVLGPARDGGYYLIGIRGGSHAFLTGLELSTPRALADTAAAARLQGCTVALAPPWADVDTLADLAALRQRLAAGHSTATATRTALRGLGELGEATSAIDPT